MTLMRLFWSMLQIGALSIGGGYAALPLIQHQIVELNGWLSAAEFADIITIAEMTPGPIAINAATFVGVRVAGIAGALVATFGCVLPSCVIVLILAKIYYKYRSLNAIQHVLYGLRPAVVGLIASAGLSIVTLAFFESGIASFAIENVRFLSLGIFGVGLFALRKWRLNPMYVLGGAGAAGLLAYVAFGV